MHPALIHGGIGGLSIATVAYTSSSIPIIALTLTSMTVIGLRASTSFSISNAHRRTRLLQEEINVRISDSKRLEARINELNVQLQAIDPTKDKQSLLDKVSDKISNVTDQVAAAGYNVGKAVLGAGAIVGGLLTGGNAGHFISKAGGKVIGAESKSARARTWTSKRERIQATLNEEEKKLAETKSVIQHAEAEKQALHADRMPKLMVRQTRQIKVLLWLFVTINVTAIGAAFALTFR